MVMLDNHEVMESVLLYERVYAILSLHMKNRTMKVNHLQKKLESFTAKLA